jgi:hypothetical protein
VRCPRKWQNLVWEVNKEFSTWDKLRIDFEEKAFYDILKELCVKHDFSYPEDKMIELAKAVKDLVDGQAKFPDWNRRDHFVEQCPYSAGRSPVCNGLGTYRHSAQDVKQYVKSIFGTTSPQYKQLSGFRYTRPTTD